jgi:carbamoyltransferase
LIDLKEDGSFRLDLQYFNYCHGLTMTSRRMDQLLGGSPRKPESPITQREMDVAASIQVVTEEIMLRMARHAYELTGRRNLCLAGGVALNCVGNGRILREGPFDHIWIQPAAGDAGGALGVALFIWHQLLDEPRIVSGPPNVDSQHGSLIGPHFTSPQVQQSLEAVGGVYRQFPTEAELLRVAAELLAEGNVVGLFQGRMEYGPRALGNRSIVGDARNERMQSVMNRKIKFRESFRPFAPAVLEEQAHEYFELPKNQSSPYMLITAPVCEDKRLQRRDDNAAQQGLDLVQHPRSVIPAVTHVDDSARIQTVDPERHGRFRRLLEQFAALTGCPVLINTSFNVRGEPIVCTPEEAFRCFMATDMDALLIEDYLLLKADQTSATEADAATYVEQFALD